MKNMTLLARVCIMAALATTVACTSMGGAHGSRAGVRDGNQGAYSQGLGDNAGFSPAVGCNVPQLGSATYSYYFDFDNSDIHAEDMNRLQRMASNLAANGAHVRVIGDTDNRGSREYNLALGYRRANAIADELKQAGVLSSQMHTNSNGAEKPVAFGESEADFQCNRRVDVIVQ